MSFHASGPEHPLFHPHFGHQPHYSQNRGPPPTKKSKGNPVITRYPPPMGYRPPIPPPGQFQQAQWQQPVQTPGYSSFPYAGHQLPQYGQAQVHQASQAHFPGYPPHSFPTNVYSPAQASHAPGAQPGWQAPVNPSQNAPPSKHYQQTSSFDHDPHRRSSAPLPPHFVQATNYDDNIDPYPPQDSPSPSDDGLEEDYEQECYFARHPEEINLKFSLGIIEWKAPLPTRRPLPSTFADAELEALAPRIPKASDLESISEYFINSHREESLNSVRLSDTWHEIKDDFIFKEFPLVCSQVMSMYELLTHYKDRFDPEWAAGERMSCTPEPSREPSPAPDRARTDSMDVKHFRDCSDNNTLKSDTDHRILDGLEQALNSQYESNVTADQRSIHSRSTSVTSQNPPRFKRPKPLLPLRDQTQENILAALGVTGSPKMVYETPGPAFGPPPEPRPEHNSRSNSLHSSRAGSQGKVHPLPTPPFLKRERSPSSDPWKNEQQGTGYLYERPSSSASCHTASGSDFGFANDTDATPRPKVERQDSRKRGYADSETGNMGDYERLDDEDTPKQRRKQPRVACA